LSLKPIASRWVSFETLGGFCEMKLFQPLSFILGSIVSATRREPLLRYGASMTCHRPRSTSCQCSGDTASPDAGAKEPHKVSVRPFLDTQAASRAPKRIALTTAMGNKYAEKLSISLGCNRGYFDEYHVLHSPEDQSSLAAVCAQPKIKCHETRAFKEPAGERFNKARALGEAQKQLHADPAYNGALIVLLNADICLPQNFVLTLPQEPKPNTLYYTAARYVYCNAAALVQKSPDWVEASMSGARGFFQAYVSPASLTYPEASGANPANTSDIAFAKGFSQTQVLQDLRVHELGAAGQDHTRAIGDAGSQAPTQFLPQVGVCPSCEGFFSASGKEIPWRRAQRAFASPVSFGDLMYN